MDFTNKNVIITGGASGIGKAVTTGVVVGGGHAIIVDLNLEAAQNVCKELGEENATAYQANMGDSENIRTVFGKILEDFGQVHLSLIHIYVFIMDRDYFNSLPEDIQAAAIEASEYASDQMNSLMLDREAETEQKLIDSGCTVLEVDTQEFIDYYADFVDTYYPELSDWANRIKAMDPNLEGAAEQEETVQDLSLIHI